jgi:hypothetical protein
MMLLLNTFTGNWQDINTQFEGKAHQLNRINGQVNWIHTIKLPKRFTAKLSGFYQSASLLGLAVRNEYGTFNMGLQKQLPNENDIIRFSIEDIFWTLPHQRFEYHQPEKGFIRHLYLRSEPRILRLTYSANFGKKNLKSNKRSTASDEERNRIGN